MSTPGPLRGSTRLAAIALALGLPAVAIAQGTVVTTLILRTGDLAPQLGTAPVFIESFAEPPSITNGLASDTSYVPIRVTLMGETIVPANKHVIYLWKRGTGLQKVVRSGEVAQFPSTTRALVTLESPIADDSGAVAFTAQTDRPARGIVVRNLTTMIGMAEVGDAVSLACESVSGAPCGPAAGTLATMPTFGDRKGAAFGNEIVFSNPGRREVVAFRGTVQAPGFGVPDALWRVDLFGNIRSPLHNLANSLLHADGITPPPVTYYDDFTDVALCPYLAGSLEVMGLATVSQGPPFAIYRFNQFGDDVLQLRHHAPDLAPRRDLHCNYFSLSFAGGVTSNPLDGNTFTRGAWSLDESGSNPTQVYRANSTPAPGIPGSALGVPLGQALGRDSESEGARPVFAANIVGSAFDGAAGVWRGRNTAEDPVLIAHEQQSSPFGSAIATIWGVHVNHFGEVVLHVRLADQRQALFAVDYLGRTIPMLVAGAPLPGDPTLVMDSFWTLGVTFGADPVVTGAGIDGIQGAFTTEHEIPVVVYTRTAAQPPGTSTGAALLHVTVPVAPPPPLFADSFESPPPPE